MTINEYQHIVDQWIKQYGVRYFSPLTNMAILTEETGEIARIMARAEGDQSWSERDKERFAITPENETERAKELLSDELSDLMWVATCIANYYHIDLDKALKANIEKKTNRDKVRHINNNKLTHKRDE